MLKYENFEDLKLKSIAKNGGRVLDVGGGRPFSKSMRKYRDLFAHSDYKTVDPDISTNPDIVGDIHNLPFDDNSIDSIICRSVLQHVSSPAIAVQEMHRVLKPGGKLFLSIPFIYPYHARSSHYSDYWRFSADAVNLLVKNFSHKETVKKGGYFLTLSFFVPGQKHIRPLLNRLAAFLDFIFHTENRTTTAGYYIFLEK